MFLSYVSRDDAMKLVGGGGGGVGTDGKNRYQECLLHNSSPPE